MQKKIFPMLYFLMFFVLATWMYAPAIFLSRVQLHGDSLMHSISILEMNHKFFKQGISPLWTNLLYGGHPYFAESQGGFLNPINIITAILFSPVHGLHFYQWLSIIIGAFGMYLFCRQFQCSKPAATFGSLAVIFSAYWMTYHDNVTVSGTLCWLPWALLCFERWVETPTFRRAVWLALSVSLLIFGGYPQVLHGAIIYMTVSIVPTLLSRRDFFKQYLITGITAAIICMSFSAVQWLPLLELSSLSTRSSGIVVSLVGSVGMYIRGFLFTVYQSTPKIAGFGIVGSVFVCFVASLSLLRKPGHRVVGILLATSVLMVTGCGYATPVFKYLLQYHIIPGLKYFRIVHIYLGISAIGIGVLAGIAIDYIQRKVDDQNCTPKRRRTYAIITSVFFLAWAGLLVKYRAPNVHYIMYTAFIVSYLLILASLLLNKTKWFSHAMLFLILSEIVLVRIYPFPFFSPELLDIPKFVKNFISDNRNTEYRIKDVSIYGGVGFVNSWSENFLSAISSALFRSTPSTNTRWDIPSLDANLALPLARRNMIENKLKAEISGEDTTPPGMRLIDYLSVRFVSVGEIPYAPCFKPFMTDGIKIVENQCAIPRIQSFTKYAIADSADDALAHLLDAKEKTLVIEPPIHSQGHFDIASLPASTELNDAEALKIISQVISNTRYQFDIDALKTAWLFIADANYPGWQADIDGISTPVYSGQILGKAVLVPSGKHQVDIEYSPRSFIYGVFISLSTLFILSILGIYYVIIKNRAGRKQQ